MKSVPLCPPNHSAKIVNISLLLLIAILASASGSRLTSPETIQPSRKSAGAENTLKSN